MKRLIFGGKIALEGSRGYARLTESVYQGFLVGDGPTIDAKSTFARYYDRDANEPDRWYLVAENGAFWGRGSQSSYGWFMAAHLEAPEQSFYLRPDADDTVLIEHAEDNLRVAFEFGYVPSQLTLSTRGLIPERFRVIPITRSYHEVASGYAWRDADLTGVIFTGMGDLLPNIDGWFWEGANLRRANFSGLDMRKIELGSRAHLPEANLSGTTFDGVDLSAAILEGANLTGASLQRVNLSAASMVGTRFTSANLTGATFAAQPRFSTDAARRTSFARATLTTRSFMDWSYLDMSEVNLQPPQGDLSGLKAPNAVLRRINLSGCNLSGAQLDRSDLSEARLESATVTGATLDGSNLTGAMLSHADLSRSSLKGVLLHRASLASARLFRANCTGAQLGATESLFAFRPQPQELRSSGEISAELREGFAAHGVALAESAQLTVRDPERTWVVASGEERYRLSLDETGAIQVRRYRAIDHAAVLSGAFMAHANFTDADLYAVNMSGAHWYGAEARANNANMEQLDGSNANFGQLDLSQAELRGATLSNAILANAVLRGARLGMSASGRPCSLVQATLVGADCTQADLSHANLHNAAVAVIAQAGGASVNGVPLFRMPTGLAADLDAGTLSSAVKGAFSAAGYPLSNDATVAIPQAGIHWAIHNGSGDGAQVGRGYATLAILRQPDDLYVYGSEIWITRVGEDGKLETQPFKYTATALSVSELNAATTCPNGRNLASNQSSGLTWEQMMTADQPPSPPVCIPSLEQFCPSPLGLRVDPGRR